jgi:hypothetical protein
VCRLNKSKYTIWKHVLKDVHFLNTNQLKTQNSIFRSNLYTPYLDDRIRFYPISSNLLTTCNKGNNRDGRVPLKLTFSERVAEVRDSPKFFLRIEYKIIPSSWQWECIESKLHGYRSVQYKLTRRDIDICTVNRIPNTAPNFLKGAYLPKKLDLLPSFRHDTTFFKYMCFLISKK